jgi:hypothetical protein
MRWPFAFRPGGGTPLPSGPAPLPSVPAVPDRPSTIVGFLSDLSMNPRQAVTFVFIVGSIIVIASLCFVGMCFAIAAASKGIKGIPLRYILSLGISGASLLTLGTTLVVRWLRKLAKAAQADATSAGKQDGT